MKPRNRRLVVRWIENAQERTTQRLRSFLFQHLSQLFELPALCQSNRAVCERERHRGTLLSREESLTCVGLSNIASRASRGPGVDFSRTISGPGRVVYDGNGIRESARRSRVGLMPTRGKSGLHRTRRWITSTIQAALSLPLPLGEGGARIARIGKVQQKANRRGECVSGEW